MINNILTTVAGFSAVAQAAAAGGYRTPGPKCHDFIIPVHASSSKMIPAGNFPSDMSKPEVFVDALLSQATSGVVANLLGGIASVEQSGDFEMSARYCEPGVHVASRAHTIQYLQHAITSGKDYWNGVTYPVGFDGDTYSYSKAASDAGYPTIAIDNLGTGNSSRPDPIAVVQMALQVQIAHEIITMLREGKVDGPVAGKKFNKVVYVGHSYGSIMGNAIAAIFPQDVNAFVLTGYTGEFAAGAPPLLSGIFVPAALAMPSKFSDRPLGYLALTQEKGREYAFFTVDNVGGFDPAIAQYDFDNQGTVAVGELATLFYGLTPAKEFTGSVFVVTGHQDAIVCNNLGGADCYKPSNKLDAAKGFWPAAKDYSYIIPEATGHAANLHYSSPESFKKVHAYLASQGL